MYPFKTKEENMIQINKKNQENTVLFVEAIRFEHWARFHCMVEMPKEEGCEQSEGAERALIQIPDVLINLCKKEVPHLMSLLARLQNTEITLDSTKNHILDFFEAYFESTGQDMNAFVDEVDRISQSKKFARYLDIFYTFVQEAAELEEKEFMEKEQALSQEEMEEFIASYPVPSFATWTEKFYTWAEERNFRLELE